MYPAAGKEGALLRRKREPRREQNFLYGSTVLMASMLVVKLAGALFKIPLTNILGETGMGFFGSAYTIYTVVYALTVAGLSTAVARMVAEQAAKGRYRDVKRIFRLSAAVFALLGTAGFLLIACSARSFAVLIDSPHSYWPVLMIAPAILFCCLMAAYRGYYEGLSNMTPTAVTQVVEVLTKALAGLFLAVFIMESAGREFSRSGTVFGIPCASEEAANIAAVPFAAAGAMLGVSISTLAGFCYIFIRHRLRGDGITRGMLAASLPAEKTRMLLGRLFSMALPITLGAVVLQLSSLIDTVTIQNRLTYCYQAAPEVLDRLYGAYLKDSEQMHTFLYGCFTTCTTLFNLVPAFTGIFAKSALPGVTSAWTRSDRSKLKAHVESVVRMTSLVASPMAFGMAFLSRPVLAFLYGGLPGVVSAGGPLLSLLAVASLFLSLVAPVNAILQGIGRTDLPVKYLCAGAAVKLLLNLILVGIPSLNILGSAISTLVCYGLIAFLSLHKLRDALAVSLDFKGMLLKPVFSGIICGFCAFLAWNALTKRFENSIILLVCIAIGGVFYLISLAVSGALPASDIFMLPGGKKIAKTLAKFHIIR